MKEQYIISVVSNITDSQTYGFYDTAEEAYEALNDPIFDEAHESGDAFFNVHTILPASQLRSDFEPFDPMSYHASANTSENSDLTENNSQQVSLESLSFEYETSQHIQEVMQKLKDLGIDITGNRDEKK